MNAWVSKRSFTRRDRAKSRPESVHRNCPPIPTLPHAEKVELKFVERHPIGDRDQADDHRALGAEPLAESSV